MNCITNFGAVAWPHSSVQILGISEAGALFLIPERYVKGSVSSGAARLIMTMQGHIGSFVTLTCPSKYHFAYASSGDRNPNWNCATPYQAQQYLNQVWARIRAELARQEIQIYGLRVAEPQRDGTPHWHMMLFMAPDHLSAFRTVFMQYALAEDGDEKGALVNRVKLVDIDPN
ncbi:MAG: replication endonuclease, partial [Gammaproteobacteria bacterium]|nr:replication endonuclease [Gammaproteobacteria bacterium]